MLNPEARAFLDACAAETPRITPSQGVAALRIANDAREMAYDVAAPRMRSETTISLARADGTTLGIEVYVPETARAPAGVLVFLHGGGWVMCSPDTHANLCRYLCAGAGVVGVNVDYRLAPEHRFPAALVDAAAALAWTRGNIAAHGGDPDRIVVGGDSAGGNLAAVLAQRSVTDAYPPLAGQILLYPSVGMGVRERFASWRDLGDGRYGISDADAEWMTLLYLRDPDAERIDPRFSPILADDLRGGPPALVVTAEYDPLRDEGRAYAARLREAGVLVADRCYAGMIHAFMSMAGAMPSAYAALDDTARHLAAAVDLPALIDRSC